jgi:pimeloyl-ACP methyl ester carboxylesterase
MRNFAAVCIASFLCLSPLSTWALDAPQAAQAIGKDPIQCGAGNRAINEEGYLLFGGIEQWVTIKGRDCGNPVILFVHGGPGNPNTPYAHPPYEAWEKDFTLVQWDQRGAGKTFSRNPATADGVLTVAAMANDGTELAAQLLRHLKARKVILFGGSWGSLLSVHMAKSRPELFAAYLGTGQLVKSPDNAIASYRALLELARAAGDVKTVAAIEALGEPPWTNPRAFDILRRASRIYEARSATPTPPAWWAPRPDYATEKMQADYEAGEDYSFIQFVGMKGNGMLSTLDLPKLGADFQMPVFMVQGESDLITVPEISKRYFDSIKAPRKEYFLVPKCGHDPNPEMIDTQYMILKTKIAPMLQ